MRSCAKAVPTHGNLRVVVKFCSYPKYFVKSCILAGP